MIHLPMKRTRRTWLLGAAAVLGLTVAAIGFLPLGRPTGGAGGLVGAQAPSLAIDAAPPPTLDGQTIDLAALRGKVVWLNFWTTSCVPCRTEMPAMQELAERYGGEGLRVIGIDVGEGSDSVREFVDELGVGYPIVLDFDSSIFSRYSPLFGVPRHYFVGRDGTIVAARIGELRPDEMEPIVRELLARDHGAGQLMPPSDDR